MTAPIVRPVATGKGRPQATATMTRATDAGTSPGLASHYIEQEYLVAGVAGTYTGTANGPAVEAEHSIPYVTRILVRHPKDPSRFSGRIVLEPFNTSGGADVDAIWARVGDVLVASGDGWVGVSQRASSETTLKEFDPQRYQEVSIPSNDLAWDLLAQVGAVLRDPGTGPLSHLRVEHLFMAGYSQSGADTATFAMAFHEHTRMADGGPVFHGYFPAAHSGSITALQSGSRWLPAFETMPMQPLSVPVVDIETQTDVEGFRVELTNGRSYTSPGSASIRRDDSDRIEDRFRLYEVAGSPHSSNIRGCDGEPSAFPTAAFVRAALVRLFAWAEDAMLPPRSARLALSTLDVVSVVKVDEVGNPVEGVRSPFVDVPLARYDAHSGPGARCVLAGRQTILPIAVLSARYGTAESYMTSFTKSLDATIASGFLLAADRDELVAAQLALAAEAFGTR